jgi:hypothetical protein
MKIDYFYININMSSDIAPFSIEINEVGEDLEGFNEQLHADAFDIRYSFYGFNKLHCELLDMYLEITEDLYSERSLVDKALKAGYDVYDKIRAKADEFLTLVDNFRVERQDVMNFRNRSSAAIEQMYANVILRNIFTFTPDRFAYKSRLLASLSEPPSEVSDEYPSNWWEREEARGRFDDYSDDSELE